MSEEDTRKRKRVPLEARIVGWNLHSLRLERNLSRREVAEILGVSFQQIQKYESGQNRFPLDKLHKLKQFYDIPYERFFVGLACDAVGKQIFPAEGIRKIDMMCEQLKNFDDIKFQQKICQAVQILIS